MLNWVKDIAQVLLSSSNIKLDRTLSAVCTGKCAGIYIGQQYSTHFECCSGNFKMRRI